ncbi:sodium/proton antiporter (CPA1 family) [Melghirimyces profundicolus]|uniref:Sodium/proton antiporter (CPA1 family) n=1 Tax=Melghirimyces profundicolus TaxID=1242148 RepID=A0A2T6BSA4_9BACL|nr:cation:proton antiporter [Melghirimyces profundicolus]PTX58896.1 sodium/proton antiporter (CPA1 family) [Melghirimyces profundicolus]
MENTFELILLLLVLAAGITALSKKLNIAYPIALVVAGTLIGLAPVSGLEELKGFVAEEDVFRFAVISIFLPALLGEATLKLPFSHLNENRKPILILAFVGTFLSYLTVGFLSMGWIGLSVTAAFTFAALMAATDPVSVLSIFKSMGVNERLSTVMEGESLVNDGLAVVLFHISSLSLLAYLGAGAAGMGMAGLEFVKVVSGGLAVGGILGCVFSRLTRFFDDYPLEIIFSVILFYGAFLVAEIFHLSGVIAVVTAGLIFGNYGARIGMNPTTKLNIRTFWDVLALLANSLVFFMVGLEVTAVDIGDKWGDISLAILIVLIARSVAVYVSLLPLRKLPRSWKHIFNWGGLRGSLSIALALSLPADFPGREEVLVLAYSVVLFSLIVQGLTLKSLVRWLGVKQEAESLTEYEERLALLQRSRAAQQELDRLKEKGTLSPVLHEQMIRKYEEKQESAREQLNRLYEERPELQQEQWADALQLVLYAEHRAVDEMEREHTISKPVADRHRAQIVDRLVGNEEQQQT